MTNQPPTASDAGDSPDPINTSDAPMRYLSISTQERPEVYCYPDSGKLGRSPPGT